MQIHELTKRRKQVDEGILDGLKAAVNTVKTGYQQGGDTLGQKLKGAAKASVSNQAYAQAKSDIDTANFNKQTANDPRIVRGKSFQQVLKNVQQDPAIKTAVQKLVPSFEQQFFGPEDPQVLAQQPQQAQPSTATAQTKPLNPTQQRVAAQNKQMSAQSGIKEARGPQAVANMKARRAATPKISVPTTAGGSKTPDGIGDEIDLWTANKIKGFNAALLTSFPEIEQSIEGPRNQLITAALERDKVAVASALQNYITVAKAGTIYAMQKQQERQTSTKIGDIGDYTDTTSTQSSATPTDAVSRQSAINNLKSLGVDSTTIAKLKQIAKQGSSDDIKTAIGLQEQLQQELTLFKESSFWDRVKAGGEQNLRKAEQDAEAKKNQKPWVSAFAQDYQNKNYSNNQKTSDSKTDNSIDFDSISYPPRTMTDEDIIFVGVQAWAYYFMVTNNKPVKVSNIQQEFDIDYPMAAKLLNNLKSARTIPPFEHDVPTSGADDEEIFKQWKASDPAWWQRVVNYVNQNGTDYLPQGFEEEIQPYQNKWRISQAQQAQQIASIQQQYQKNNAAQQSSAFNKWEQQKEDNLEQIRDLVRKLESAERQGWNNQAAIYRQELNKLRELRKIFK